MTATDLLLTDDDELAIVNGDWAFATDAAAILQGIKIRLRFFQGEWVFDLEIGIDYWNSVLIKNPSLIVVREIFRRALLSSPGVVEVVNLNVAYTKRTPRTVAVTWTVRGDVGQLIRGGIERSA